MTTPQTPSPQSPRIDIADPLALHGGAALLDGPPAELRDTVVQVGDDAEAVALVLKGSTAALHH
jgi:hypothetical protein